MLDPRALPFSHDWGVGGEDQRSLGARILGGCSSHNACMVAARHARGLRRVGAGVELGSVRAVSRPRGRDNRRPGNGTPPRPAPFHEAFVDAAIAEGHVQLDQARGCSVLHLGSGRSRPTSRPARAGTRPSRISTRHVTRPNLTIHAETLVDRLRRAGLKSDRRAACRRERPRGGDDRRRGGRVLLAGDPDAQRDRPRARAAPAQHRRDTRSAGRRDASSTTTGPGSASRAVRRLDEDDRRTRTCARTALRASRRAQGGKQRLRCRHVRPSPSELDQPCRRIQIATSRRWRSSS